MEPKDSISIAALALSAVAFALSLRKERRASQDSIIKAFQGDKEAVMYVACKATSEKWRKRLKNATFRNDVVTAMTLSWVAESSDRAKALVFAALRQIVSSGHSAAVQSVLKVVTGEFISYKQRFNPGDFQRRIDALQLLTKELGL